MKGLLKLSIQRRKRKKRMKRNKESLQNVRESTNRNNIWTMGIWEYQEGKTREKRPEISFKEIMAENTPNMQRYMDIQIHEA